MSDPNNERTDSKLSRDELATRRTFLKGSGALASSAALLNHASFPDDESVASLPGDPDDSDVREFTIHAIPVDIVYNRFGLHQPRGAMYVLEENRDEARRASGRRPGDAFDDLPEDSGGTNESKSLSDTEHDTVSTAGKDGYKKDIDTSVIQPLSIRANQGDVVKITFVNELDRHASIHQTALPYDVETSDGMSVGFNPDTTAAPGETIEYTWYANNLGTHFFMDGANQAFDSANDPPQRANLLSRGLFGGISVYPEGTTWSDPETGGELRSGLRANIHHPEFDDHREFQIFYHTPEGIQTPDGGLPEWPRTDEEQHVHAINYRADPLGDRIRDDPDCADCDKEEYFYNSWIHGDPGGGDNVYETYLGDPTKVLAIGASHEEHHVHHLHGHRWKEVPERSSSDTIDSQTIGLGAVYEARLVAAHGPRSARPGMTFEEAFEPGAGGFHESAGDYLFHCHLFPHYGEGMWGIMRVNDKEQPDLVPLPNNDPPLEADSEVPGYPDFIPGEKGEAPPKPPYQGIRDPTPEEEQALGDIEFGAPYTDPCIQPGDDGTTREYNIVALPADIVYNDAGDHDPDGQVFVLEEDEEAVRNGNMNPEPLVIRANVGDCIEITLRNELPQGRSNHIHFVSYDVLGSDSLATGYNYDQATEPGDEMFYRWFADEEGMIFFHDHIVGIDEVMNGNFAALIVEPEGSEWFDPHTGDPIRSGTQAIIEDPNGRDFREFALFWHDFAQLVNRNGNFVNPDEEHNQNAGVMAINYRNAPYYRRRDGEDPAYVHSSYVHGDPPTPVLESYEDDPIRIRLVQSAYEEQHNFTIHGLRVDPEGLHNNESVSQIVGTSEAFTFDLQEDGEFDQLPNPDGLPVRDYLYGSMVVDDLWNGMWGINRIWGGEVDHLQPLPDRSAPAEKISEEELRKMGHPAPCDRRAELGHKAKLLYDKKDHGHKDSYHVQGGKKADRRFPPNKPCRQNKHIGKRPPKAPSPGDPCPDDAPVRRFNVTAFQHDILYNDEGDHDPHGIVYALDEHVEEIKEGIRPLEPLTIRANRGDCIEINLTNALPEKLDNDHAHPEMRVEQRWPNSSRISLHPQTLEYDVQGSDGATVGFNFDQTIEPGDTITYRWLADGLIPDEHSGCVLWDMADIRSHRHHGAFGQLVIEPEGSNWLDPRTSEPLPAGGSSMIVDAPTEDFREFALAWADGQYIVNPSGRCVVPPGPDTENPNDPCNQIGDDEDQGYMSINYASEPFVDRLRRNPNQHLVYDSTVHGDPSTPVLNAQLDDPVKFRISQTADKARGLDFHLAAHQWRRFPEVEMSPQIGVDDRFSPGKTFTVDPLGGAGGLADSTGDFIYQETKQVRRLEAGWWGIFRVRDALNQFKETVQPLPDRAHGMLPEDVKEWTVLRGDVTGDGHEDVLVVIPRSNVAAWRAGAAYLFRGPVEDHELFNLANADVQFLGESRWDRAGFNAELEENLIILDTKWDTRYIIDATQSLPKQLPLRKADSIIDLDC